MCRSRIEYLLTYLLTYSSAADYVRAFFRLVPALRGFTKLAARYLGTDGRWNGTNSLIGPWRHGYEGGAERGGRRVYSPD